MTVRWYLGAAFGPHEAGPRWVFIPLAAFGLVSIAPLAYLKLRRVI